MDCLAPTYFFEQSSLRRAPKRYKKLPEELPQDLRFAYVTPRVSVYLGEKEKESFKVNEQDTSFGDGLGNKSLLPQISAKVTLLQNQLNNAFSNDEDSQRFLFDRAKTTAGSIIQQLSRILYLFDGLRVGIPKPLEHQLSSNYKDMTADVNLVPREWQLPANKEEYLKKMMPRGHGGGEDTMRSSDDTHTDTGSVSNVSRHTGEDDTRSVKSATEKDANKGAPGGGGAGARAGQPRTKTGTKLQDIAEDHGEQDARTTSRLGGPPGGGKRDKAAPSPSNRPKTRLDGKLRPGGAPSVGTESRASGLVSHRSNTASRPKHDDIQSIIAESTSDATLVDRTGYWTIIQFQLSSKQCEDKGWICTPQVQPDREQETVLEWATQRMQMTIKQKREQQAVDKENGRDKPLVVRYYGDNRRDAMLRRAAATTPLGRMSSSMIREGQLELPDVPELPCPAAEPTVAKPGDNKKIFVTTVTDGSTTIYYPSGLIAVVTSCCPVRKSGYYTVAYDDTPDKRMLAAFTPSGRGTIYHKNGVVKFLSNDKEWTLSDEQGAITRRSKWPSNGLKMPAGVSIQVNSFLVLRVASHASMQLVFNAVKESAKVSVGATTNIPSIDDMKDEQLELLSGLPFTSQTAKVFMKPQKPNSKAGAKVKVQKSSKGRKTPSDIQKLLDMPEATENDAEADKNLYRLQRKVKNLVEDWLEHYRIAVGISSPHLRTLHSAPHHRQRTIHSAKSSPAGVRVIIESLSTAVPHVPNSQRIPSAPAGRPCDRLSISRAKPRPASTATAGNTVKFDDDNIEEIEPDDLSVIRTTPLPSSAVSGCSTHSIRSQSACTARGPPPVAMSPDTVWSLRFGACPVALRQMMFGDERATCRCSRHKIPYINDIEYDEFIHKHTPPRQMVVIAVISSLFPEAMPAMDMLESMYTERNRNRTQPCIQARGDAYRMLLYDVAAAADLTDHSNPLLLRRHNVVPGMFLIYDNGQLVFCDHIFNGYGNARKDFQKQIMATKRTASMGRHLPKDFKFSPQRGKSGRRSAWGGEIGGAGVDNYGHAGISIERLQASETSLSTNESKELLRVANGLRDGAARFINIRVTSTGIHLDQNISPRSPRSPRGGTSSMTPLTPLPPSRLAQHSPSTTTLPEPVAVK